MFEALEEIDVSQSPAAPVTISVVMVSFYNPISYS
jgi:hypothetical protein